MEQPSAVERAKAVIAPYLDRPGMLGAFLTGGAARPFGDALSDLDIICVYEDEAYAAVEKDKRVVAHYEGEGASRRKIYDFLQLSKSRIEEQLESKLDHLRWGFQHGIVLHDPTGWLTRAVHAAAQLPDDIREARVRAHCYEYLWAEYRAERASKRPHVAFMAGALRSTGLIGLCKALLCAAGIWPSKLQWLTHELAILGAPAELVSELEHAFGHLDTHNEKVRPLAFEWLASKGYSFQFDSTAVAIWGVGSPDGIDAIETWVRTH
ncbi:MAG TPA: hypothetical protein VGM90_36260 [Kofleriaceae bacterium]|jgi:hypothetical protein